MKKKVIHVIDSLKKGGAESLLVTVLNELSDYENIVVTLYPDNDYSTELKNKFKIISLHFGGVSTIFDVIKKLQEFLLTTRPAIIHSHLFWSSLITRIATRKKGNYKVFFTNHTMLSHEAFRRFYFVWLERLTYKKHHHLISVSKTVELDYAKFVSLQKSTVLYNFIGDRFFRLPKFNEKRSHKLKCVAVGTHKAAKNYEFLIRHFPKNEAYSLAIFGRDDKEGSLEKMIRSREYKNIEFKGQTNQVHLELRNYDLFIMSSIYEGQPISALEAMANGLPVLLSDIPSLREAGGATGIYYSLENKSELEEKLERIMKGEIDLKVLSQKCYERANQLARKEIHLTKLKQLYEA